MNHSMNEQLQNLALLQQLARAQLIQNSLIHKMKTMQQIAPQHVQLESQEMLQSILYAAAQKQLAQ